MEHLLRYALLALLGQPRASLKDILPMYLEKDFRRMVLETVRDEQLRACWE